MNRKRYIRDLSESEKAALATVVKKGATHRERQRAQAILWSHQGKDMQTLLEWLKVDLARVAESRSGYTQQLVYPLAKVRNSRFKR